MRKYEEQLETSRSASSLRIHLRGLVFGLAQSVPFLAYSGCMIYGGYLVDTEGLEYKKVFK